MGASFQSGDLWLWQDSAPIVINHIGKKKSEPELWSFSTDFWKHVYHSKEICSVFFFRKHFHYIFMLSVKPFLASIYFLLIFLVGFIFYYKFLTPYISSLDSDHWKWNISTKWDFNTWLLCLIIQNKIINCTDNDYGMNVLRFVLL